MMQPNILEIHIEEPTSDPAQPSVHHSLADDLGEAEKRYRALIHVLISQLTGLSQTHVRFVVSPRDPAAVEAVGFWMLPLFRGKVIKHGDHFHFTPEQKKKKKMAMRKPPSFLPTAHSAAHAGSMQPCNNAQRRVRSKEKTTSPFIIKNLALATLP